MIITGANGLVGRAMARRFPDAVALTHVQLDITDEAAVRALRADVILNCAVVGVEASERDPALAEAVNVRGPALLASVCERLVHFSTNSVDGVYGRTKREGERYAAMVIRTSWVFGAGKDNFFSTVHRRLRNGERVRAADDVRSSVTYVEHLAQRAAEICGTGSQPVRGGGVENPPHIFEIANDGLCSPYEFALEAARLVGADRSLIEACAGGRGAPPIVTDPPLASWRRALAEYIECAP